MKLIEHFKTFMADEVNLNQTRVTQLENSIEAVKTAIRDSDWGATIRSFAPQGSWAHQTIIKPLPGDEFDADLLVFVKPKDGWEPKDYIDNLYWALRENGTYKDKVRRYSHCITIEYAGERRIDVAPCVQDRWFFGYEVCNRDTNEYEASNPLEYTEWVVEKNTRIGNNNFRKVTRLLKYMRDIKGTFTCPSFLLTTLLGERIGFWDSPSSAGFSDLPTALKTIVGRLDDWMQPYSEVPTVCNPKLWSEVQSDVWTDTQFLNFKDKINKYRGWIDEAYDEEDRDESIAKWRRVFGDGFASGEVAQAARVSEAVAKSAGYSLTTSGMPDLVALVKEIGQRALPVNFCRLPHVQAPIWVRIPGPSITVKVQASLQGNAGPLGSSLSSLTPARKGQSVRFSAVNNAGVPFSSHDYKVMWRVTNTDKDAAKAKCLRGDFYSSDTGTMSRTESLSYRGVHFVEAFLIRRANDGLVGKSEPFYVVIE